MSYLLFKESPWSAALNNPLLAVEEATLEASKETLSNLTESWSNSTF